MILEKFKETIKEYKLIERGDKIIVALSGGPDSVCMLHLLNSIKEEYGLKLYAAHLNHQIRGIEAQKDALYAINLCDSMGINCFLNSIDVPKFCEENGYSIEEGARYLRYKMFFDLKEKLGAQKIAIAHNKDDQGETLLMRIMRGTGLDGLKGIDYKRKDGIIRPLLKIAKKDINEYCQKHGLEPRIDHTNFKDIYTRNKIRLNLMPYMEKEFNPNLKDALMNLSDIVKDDADYINKNASSVFENIAILEGRGLKIRISDLKSQHNAILKRLIRKSIEFILDNIKGIEMVHINDVIDLFGKPHKNIDLPKGLKVYNDSEYIIFTTEVISVEYKMIQPVLLKLDETIQVPVLNASVETKTMKIEEYKKQKPKKYQKFFDLDKIKGDITIRSRKNGDKIRPLGMRGSKKVKDILIDEKIPREKRELVPIVCDSEQIMWVCDYKMGENHKIDANTENVFMISIRFD